MRELKDELIQQRQQHLDEKQRRAEQQRLLVLQEKVRKAQEEEAKVCGKNFLNEKKKLLNSCATLRRLEQTLERVETIC